MPLGAFKINGLGKYITVSGGGGTATRTPIILTPVGNAQMDTSIKKFGSASYKGDGTGDGLLNTSLGSYASKNFTFECWFNPSTISGNQTVAVLGMQATSNYSAAFIYRNGTTLRIYASYNGAAWDAANGLALGTVAANTWYHVAVVRVGTSYKVYQDGVLLQNLTLTGNLTSGTGVTIGSAVNGSASFAGNIDEVRVSKNARYTAAFTPPTAAFTDDTNTELLVHCDGLNGQTLFPDDNSDTYTMAYITPNKTFMIEGENISYTLETLNAGSTVYYSLDGTVSANDFSSGSLTGSVNLTNNKGSFTVTSTSNTDSPAGAETFITNLRKDSTSGTIIASTATITLNDPGISNTWDTYTKLDILTSVSRYSGVNQATIAIHGVQNTNKLVMVLGAQNLAKNAHYLYPAVLDLTTKEFVVGTGVAFGNTSNPTATTQSLSVAGEGNVGMGSTTTYSSSQYYVNVRGYTITNWGSCSTTSLPTLSLSTAWTRATYTVSADCYIGYLGNGRWLTSQYDGSLNDGGGWLHSCQIFSYSANGSVAVVATSGSLSGRGLGLVDSARNGISSSNYAGHMFFAGSNANTINVYFIQGTGSTIKNLFDSPLPSSGGNSFQSKIFYTPSGKAFIFSQMGNGSTITYQVVTEWTNPNTPGSNPTITNGTYYDGHTTPGRIVAPPIIKETINSAASFYTPVNLGSGQHRFDVYNFNTTTRAYSSKTTGQTAWSNWSGDLYWESWYDATYGQYIFQFRHDTISGVSLYIHKWNP